MPDTQDLCMQNELDAARTRRAFCTCMEVFTHWEIDSTSFSGTSVHLDCTGPHTGGIRRMHREIQAYDRSSYEVF